MSKGAKIGVAVICFAAAGVIFAITSREQKAEYAPDAADVHFVCTKCEHNLSVSPQESEVLLAEATKRETIPTPEESGARRTRFAAQSAAKIRCEKCGEVAVVRARYCQEHDTYYPATGEDGQRGVCPRCAGS